MYCQYNRCGHGSEFILINNLKNFILLQRKVSTPSNMIVNGSTYDVKDTMFTSALRIKAYICHQQHSPTPNNWTVVLDSNPCLTVIPSSAPIWPKWNGKW